MWSAVVDENTIGGNPMFLILIGICFKIFNNSNKKKFKKRKAICGAQLWKIFTKMMSRYKRWNYWNQIMKCSWNGHNQRHFGRQFFKNGLNSLMSGKHIKDLSLTIKSNMCNEIDFDWKLIIIQFLNQKPK